MSDPRTPLAASFREQPAEEAQREERHQLLATLLGAFADGELPAETASQIDAHLLGCPRCRRELVAQRSLRLRLEQEPLAPAPTAFRDRILSAIAAAPVPQWETVAATTTTAAVTAPAVESNVVRRVNRTTVVVGVAIALVLAAFGGRWFAERGVAPRASVVASESVPLFAAALADYRRVTSSDLPGRSRDLATVRAAVAFPVEALQGSSLRLLAVWTTTLDGEPAAVLAYRWNDAVVLQYVVSELQLYRPAELRTAFANGRAIAAHAGSQSVVAWPEPASGSLVVGEISVDKLQELRSAVAPR